jgi:ABC-type cobalamin transport system ATPase subunit
MLDAVAPDQILARGQGWSSIVSGDTSQGSRLEQVVARLCRCGITIVMQARRRDGLRETMSSNS